MKQPVRFGVELIQSRSIHPEVVGDIVLHTFGLYALTKVTVIDRFTRLHGRESPDRRGLKRYPTTSGTGQEGYQVVCPLAHR